MIILTTKIALYINLLSEKSNCCPTAMEQGSVAVSQLRRRTVLGVADSISELLPSPPKSGEDTRIHRMCERRKSCEVLAQAWKGAGRGVPLH